MLTQTIGFIGSGQMARALAQGFVAAGLVPGRQIVHCDPVPAAAKDFESSVEGSRAAASNSDVVGPEKLMVSIAAGITLAKLCEGLKSNRVVRVMPNTPALIGKGASAYSLGPEATAADGELVGQLLGAVGQAFWVDEKLLDAVTGLSGSGPAFVYVMIEALSDGGVRVGLPRDVATALAAQTVRGAAEMVVTTGEHPAVLKDKVASPGGTTIAGLAALESGGLRAALIAAVEAATKRSAELGKG
jgi:pyrroline-5-carboxylate reductase